MIKKCPRCKIKKEASAFTRAKERKDGLQVYCKDCRNAYARTPKRQEYQRNYVAKNKDKRSKIKTRWLNKLKLSVFSFYGGVPPKCACCGEKEIIFLCIDHINGGGSKHRKELKNGSGIYQWLKNQNYPVGYRVLCCNCNWGIFRNKGVCPHKEYG